MSGNSPPARAVRVRREKTEPVGSRTVEIKKEEEAVSQNNGLEYVTSSVDNSTATSSQCVVCAEDIVYYAVANCTPSHPVCSKCILRLRYLQKDSRCPVCRSEIVWVLFAKRVLSDWDQNCIANATDHNKCILQLKEKYFEVDETFKIVFDSRENYEEFLHLTTITCKLCEKTLRSEEELKTHLRKMHETKLCEICLVHIKRFPTEYVYYDRAQLAVHNKTGDKETLGQKGHPLCEFCQKRFLDPEELETHQRREHYYCHFCADQGFVDFFPDPYFLKRHYKSEHILCEEGDCASDYGFFTSVFNNDVDYQAHRLREHGKSYSKKIRDQLKQIPLAFETPYSRNSGAAGSSSDSRPSRHQRGGGGRGGGGGDGGVSERGLGSRSGQSGGEYYGGMDDRRGQQGGSQQFMSHSRQQNQRQNQNQSANRNRYGGGRDRDRDRRGGDEDRGYYSGSSNSQQMACSPPKVDLNIPPSERGFFEVPSKPPRAEGVPLSEQHKLTTTIATAVEKYGAFSSSSLANQQSANNQNGASRVNGELSSVGATDGPNQNMEEDFPDLPNTTKKSTNFWGGFDSNTMKGIDRLQETHFPALPQSDNPIKKSKMKKTNNTQLQSHSANMQVKKPAVNSAWGSSSTSPTIQPKVTVAKSSAAAAAKVHKVESSPSLLQQNNTVSLNAQSSSSNGLLTSNMNSSGFVGSTNSVWNQGQPGSSSDMPSLQESNPSIHPNFMVVRPKTKSGKKKKKKNDPDDSVSSIKSILSAVNDEVSNEEANSLQNSNGWMSFESNNNDIQKSKANVEARSLSDQTNNSSREISFSGLTLKEIEEQPRSKTKGESREAILDAPPGFAGDEERPKLREPILELPPGFDSPKHSASAKCVNQQTDKKSDSSKNGVKSDEKKRAQKDYEYFYPEDFDIRNRKLNAMIRQLLVNRTTGDEKLYHDFLKITKSFSRNQGSANAVVNFCRYNLGDNFYLVFIEVLCLLPNISCQRKLLASFDRQKPPRENCLDDKITSCQICSQIVAHKDKDFHMKKAHDDETLSTAGEENCPPF